MCSKKYILKKYNRLIPNMRSVEWSTNARVCLLRLSIDAWWR